MKLEPDERSILASFASGPVAEEALEALRKAGFAEIQMDRIGRHGFDPDVDEQRPAIAGAETSAAAAVLDPDQMGDDSRVLLAAMPDASGMAGEIVEDVAPFLVTVLTDRRREAEALRILREHGGRV